MASGAAATIAVTILVASSPVSRTLAPVRVLRAGCGRQVIDVKVSARWSEAESCFSIIAASANRIQAPEIICDAYTLQSSSTTVARGELKSARQFFAVLIEGIWFAQDSPLEGRSTRKGPGVRIRLPPAPESTANLTRYDQGAENFSERASARDN